MNLTNSQIRDIKHAVEYFMNNQVSINNPLYNDYKIILELIDGQRLVKNESQS